MPNITLPPLVHYLIAAVSCTAALLFTQSLIDNRTEKLVTGLGSIWIPIGYLVLVANAPRRRRARDRCPDHRGPADPTLSVNCVAVAAATKPKKAYPARKKCNRCGRRRTTSPVVVTPRGGRR